MPTYQAFSNFTAQGKSIRALFRMYALLEQDNQNVPLEPIVVFLAFSIESYLNSIGDRVIPFWEEIERLPWKSKISVLHTHADKTIDWGQEPLQFASEVFRLRDKLAHGKPEKVLGQKYPETVEPEKIMLAEKLQPDWYTSINHQWIMAARPRFDALMTYLGGLFGFPESDHLHSSHGGILVNDD